jgi:hypothetical protein
MLILDTRTDPITKSGDRHTYLSECSAILGSALDFMPSYLPVRPGNCVYEIPGVVNRDPNGTDPVASQRKILSLVLYRPV